jgi:hypothetical protein
MEFFERKTIISVDKRHETFGSQKTLEKEKVSFMSRGIETKD